MRPHALLLGMNAALLLSTAVSAADAITPAPVMPATVVFEEPALFSLTIEGGVSAFGMPSTDTIGTTNIGGLNGDEVLFEGLDDMLFGGNLAAKFSAPINDSGAGVTVSGFGAFATRSGSQSRVLDDERLLVIHGPTLPVGTIGMYTWDLDGIATGTGVGDLGDAESTVTAGGGVAIPTANAATILGPVQDVESSPDGFTYAGVIGDYQTFSLGALATTDGAMFVGYGELLGWEVSTDVTQNMVHSGADLTFSQTSSPDGGNVAFTGYAGPSFRYLSTETTTQTSVTPRQFAEYAPDFEYAMFSLDTIETIDTYYAGGVVGGNIDVSLWSGSTLSLGVGGGAYYASSHYASETEATLSGGSAAADESVFSTLNLEPETGFAYTAKADGKFSAHIGERLQLNFGLGAEYLSRVASARFAGSNGMTVSDTAGDDVGVPDADFDSSNATGSTILTFGDAMSYKATIGLTGQF
ncbi:hypothetical protein SAMN02983003_3411 [Devosia enhydra]|uniref:Uncharacterized protein n=1 Tax=Devosia enhydra TaxID=665118 RepID=A0A1K2I1N0_9HYPH|nr:hypothetical protein SAMN02983003_3411 [Devosia enhydra]